MKVLLSNDDGYQAQGLITLIEALSEAGHDVIAFSPHEEKSGQGMAITLRQSVRVEQHGERLFVVHGTPVDCVNLAQTSGLIDCVEILISGMNHGPNLGDDTLYSGTVAAALEARHLPMPSIACSINSFKPRYFECAAKWLIKFIEKTHLFEKKDTDVLNINIPDLPFDDIKGFEFTRLSKRELSLPPESEQISDSESDYRIGGVGDFMEVDVEPHTQKLRYDFLAVQEGYISVTAIKARLLQSDIPHQRLVDALNS